VALLLVCAWNKTVSYIVFRSGHYHRSEIKSFLCYSVLNSWLIHFKQATLNNTLLLSLNDTVKYYLDVFAFNHIHSTECSSAWLHWTICKPTPASLLCVPRTRRHWCDRAFSVAAPSVWNALPQHLTTAAFKVKLKTYLFTKTFCTSAGQNPNGQNPSGQKPNQF